MLLKEEAEVAHIKSGSQGKIGNVLSITVIALSSTYCDSDIWHYPILSPCRISHDANTAKIVIYMTLRTDRPSFFTILPAENPVLSKSTAGAVPENEQEKETSSTKRTSALLHPFRGGLYAVFRVFRAMKRT